MFDEWGFETEREYTIQVDNDIDVSVMDDNIYVGSLRMTNGKNTFDVDWEHSTTTGKTGYTYYEKGRDGQYHEADLPLEVAQSVGVFNYYVKEKVQEHIEQEKQHNKNRDKGQTL